MYTTGRWGFKLLCLIWGRVDTCICMVEFLLCSPGSLTILLWPFTGQEATVRTGHGTTDWLQIGKGVPQGCTLSPCLLNLSAEYVMWNARLDEAQTGIKIARRNINNLRYEDNTILMADSREAKRLLMKVKDESERSGLKLTIQETKIMASSPITSWQIDGETVETVTDFIFLASKINPEGDCSHEIKTLAPWKRSYEKHRQRIKKQKYYFSEKSL